MDESKTMENPEKPKNDKFLLTDENISILNPKFNFASSKFESLYRKSIFHKYFLSSINEVQKDVSREALLVKLQEQLDQGIYHFPFTDIDELFEKIFNVLPKSEVFASNPVFIDKLFIIMNYFMLRFYDFAFPFFYNITIEDNFFTYGPAFVIKYINHFSNLFHTKQNETQNNYINLLIQDGSMTNILNYLFDIYINGTELLNEASQCIYSLMSWLNCNYLRDYLQQKGFIEKKSAIFVNSGANIIYRMNFLLAFYKNYFLYLYDEPERKIKTNFLKCHLHYNYYMIPFEQQEEAKQAISQELLNDIKDLNVFDYLKSYLSNYTDRMIIEGRLLNTKNLLITGETSQISSTMNIYPPTVEDQDIHSIFDLLIYMFRFIDKPDEDTARYVLDFVPIVQTLYQVAPGIFHPEWCKWGTYLLDVAQNLQIEYFNSLKGTILEIIQNRIDGNFKEDINCNAVIDILASIERKNFPTDEALYIEVNRTSICSYIQLLFSVPPSERLFISEEEFLSLIQFSSLDFIKEWFHMLSVNLKDLKSKNVLAKVTLEKFGNKSVEPDFIECIFELFNKTKFTEEDYTELNEKGILPSYFEFLIKTPQLEQFILSEKIFSFVEKIGKYITDDELIGNTINTAINEGNIFVIKLISIILKSKKEEDYIRFTKDIVDHVIESVKIADYESNEQIIQRIILVSPFLISFKFTENEKIYDLLKSTIGFLNGIDQEKTKLICIDNLNEKRDRLKFSNVFEQAKVNIIYSLVNSFGFHAANDCIEYIGSLLNNENIGMCIEVLNIMANIIGLLVDHLGDENISEEINKINDMIFKIVEVLIANTPPEAMNVDITKYLEDYGRTLQIREKMKEKGDDDDDDHHHHYHHRMPYHKINKYEKKEERYVTINFALYPIGSEDSRYFMPDHHEMPPEEFEENEERIQEPVSNSCRYSCQMKHEIINFETFSVNTTKYCPIPRFELVYVVNLFVRNIANYVINLLTMFGMRKDSIKLFKQIIMYAFKNGLIQVNKLESFFKFVIAQDEFFTDSDEVSFWVSGAIERASALINSKAFDDKEERNYIKNKFGIGKRKEFLQHIFTFLYNMEQIFPGAVSEELVNLMFTFVPQGKDPFMNFLNSDKSCMDASLEDLFAQMKPKK